MTANVSPQGSLARPRRRHTRSERSAHRADVRSSQELDPCPICGVGIWWRHPGDVDVRCWFCTPPKTWHGAEFYFSPVDAEPPELSELLAELIRPATVAALTRASQALADRVVALMEHATLASAAGDEATYKATAAELVTLMRQVRQRYGQGQT